MLALMLALAGVTNAGSAADTKLLTGKRHPFVFVTQAEIEQARKQIFAQGVRSKVEAFKLQQQRADHWLHFTVPPKLPFNRQFGDAVRDLALVFALKGGEAYAAKAAEILRAIAGSMTDAQPGSLYLAVHSLPIVFGLDLLTPYLGSAAEPLQHRLLDPVVQALRTRSGRGLSNQDVWANAAVAAIGFLREDQGLVDWAVFNDEGGVLRQVDEGIWRDGMWHERPLHYHFYTLHAFLVVAEAMSRSGMKLDLYAWTSPRGRSIGAMFLSPLGLLDPALTLPGSGDSFGTPKIQEFWHYIFGWRRYGAQAFAWVLSHAKHPLLDSDVFATAGTLFNDRELPEQVTPPEAPSQVYRDAGWMSLRSNESRAYWRSDAVQVLLSYGGGETHDHADKLNIDIAGRSERLLEDKSVFAYGDGGASPEAPEGSRHRLWDRQTVAHNTVVVNQQSQPGAQSMFQATRMGGIGRVFVRCDPINVARASADSAYAGVQYARQVALVGSEYVVDLFRVASGQSQVYDWVLHVNRAPAVEPRTDLNWHKVPPFPGSDGYQMISNLRSSHTLGPWSLEWPQIKIWMAGGTPTEVFLGAGYGGPTIQQGVWQVVGDPEPSRIPIVLVRRQAAYTVFAAVIELFKGAPAITRVEPITDDPNVSALRIQRADGVDLYAVRWASGGGVETVDDPVTKVSVPVGDSFTFTRIRGSMVQQWSDVRTTSAGMQPQHAPTSSVPRSSRVREQHQCRNEVQDSPQQ
jgi:hypothetical protein